jgi:hypothetical protein
MKSAPLRFLLSVLVLWIGIRAAILLPGWPEGAAPVPAAAAQPRPIIAAPSLGRPATADIARVADLGEIGPMRFDRGPVPQAAVAAMPEPVAGLPIPPPWSTLLPVPAPAKIASSPAPVLTQPLLPPRRAVSSHWSLSAWLLVRDEGNGPVLAPGGTLGGSQAGARLAYALGGGFSLSGRAYLPLRRTEGAELAAGIDWRPVRALPVNLLADRRQRLGRDGRNAFALTLYGGSSRGLTPRVRLDLYGQAGVVGLRSRDLFADGALRLSRRLGPVELGAGVWGAAQPGAARLDAGPSLSWRLPIRDTNLRLQADWRFRVAGEALPRSGPALTLGADF